MPCGAMTWRRSPTSSIFIFTICVALYIGVQQSLLPPIETDAAHKASIHAELWFTDSPIRACSPLGPPGRFGPPSPDQGSSTPEMVACFDQNGSLLPIGNTAQL